MNQPDEKSVELISAYLDGEVTESERLEVERWLTESETHGRLFDELRYLGEQIRSLPSYQLDADFHRRVLQEIARRRAMVEVSSDELEMISAYIDDELAEDERRRVEHLISSDERHLRVFEELKAVSARLQGLPTYRLDSEFSNRVLQQIAQQHSLHEHQQKPMPVGPIAREPGGMRGVIWAALTVAAALMLAFFMRDKDPGLTDPGETIHQDPIAQSPLDDPQDRPPKPELAPEVIQWVRMAGENSKMLIVYELLIDQEGVEQAAFANLLARHNIDFTQTVAVPRSKQEKLLEKQFLQGMQIAEPAHSLDPVDLYLVRCKAAVIGAIWQDLKSRPDGIRSFYMNVSSLDANDGALRDVCDLAEGHLKSGQASQLLTQLAILSRSGRQLGVFGMIRSVDPELLDPTLLPSNQENSVTENGNDAVEWDGRSKLDGDFDERVLFVVRRMKRLEDDDE